MKDKWLLLSQLIFITVLFFLLSIWIIYYYEEINYRSDIEDTIEITEWMLYNNSLIYNEAVENYIFNSDENWNEQIKLQELFETFKVVKDEETKSYSMTDYLWITEEWNLYKEVNDWSLRPSILYDLQLSCIVSRNNYYDFHDFTQYLMFIDFVELLENRKFKIKSWIINEKTIRNLVKAKYLMKENIEKFHKEWCKKEYIEEFKKHYEFVWKRENWKNFLEKIEHKNDIEINNKLKELLRS